MPGLKQLKIAVIGRTDSIEDFMTPEAAARLAKRYQGEITHPLRQWHQRLGLPRVMEHRPEDNGTPLAGATRQGLAAPVSPVEYGIDEDVLEGVYDYNKALLQLALQIEKPDLTSSYGRFHEKALRVAALLASLAGCDSIHLNHWARAQQVAEHWRLSLHRLYRQVNAGTPSPEARLEDWIMKKVKRLGHPSRASA